MTPDVHGHFATMRDGTRVWVGPANAQAKYCRDRVQTLEGRIARALTAKTLDEAQRYLLDVSS